MPTKTTEPEQTPTVDSLDTPISTKDLLALLAKMNNDSSTALANAILESRKPYLDPKQQENEEMFRSQTRRQMAEEREALRASQEVCPHVIGCNSLSDRYDRNGLTSIIWHTYDDQEVRGLCTVCQRAFLPEDQDYYTWRRMPSANRPSSSGFRQYLRARRSA